MRHDDPLFDVKIKHRQQVLTWKSCSKAKRWHKYNTSTSEDPGGGTRRVKVASSGSSGESGGRVKRQ